MTAAHRERRIYPRIQCREPMVQDRGDQTLRAMHCIPLAVRCGPTEDCLDATAGAVFPVVATATRGTVPLGTRLTTAAGGPPADRNSCCSLSRSTSISRFEPVVCIPNRNPNHKGAGQITTTLWRHRESRAICVPSAQLFCACGPAAAADLPQRYP